MGAKSPEKLKLRRQPCKCEVCGRNFLNVQALVSHRKFMHKPKPVAKKRMPLKKSPVAQGLKVVKKKVSNLPPPKKGTRIPSTKIAKKASLSPKIEVPVEKKASPRKKIEFKCPKCVRKFTAYFSAYRHIQKHHCVDNNDKDVAPNSPDIIQPIRLELCAHCNEYFSSSEIHMCDKKVDVKLEPFMCLGCQQTFDTLVLFENHVKGFHASQADCLFFSSYDEYTSWQSDLEDVTKATFVSLAAKQKSRHMYHCSHRPTMEMDKTFLCPSALSVTELGNGFLVYYYKEHFGHSCLDLPVLKYKKCSTLPYLKEEIKIDSDDYVYQQFKSVMTNITVNASRVDTNVLYTLLEKALAMTVVIHNSLPDEELSITNKTMTDEQITKVLSEVKTYPAKRKGEISKKGVKKLKQDTENDENSKSNLLTKPMNQTEAKTDETLPPNPRPQFQQSSPSFNDSYKDFVDQNFKTSLLDTSTPKKSVIKKKVVMKTKIGQFKVRPSLSPKEPAQKSPVPFEVRPVLSPTMPGNLSPKESTFSYTTPKKHSKHKYIEFNIKPDIEYEVKEQENDCNILILKI